MRISKLYTNFPKLFEPIDFNRGFNVVLAEIRLPQNLKKDSHNLGKSTLGRLIDYCLLAERDPDFFLFKNIERFRSFVFFLELELLNKKFITVRRSVEFNSKISISQPSSKSQDLSKLEIEAWEHSEIALDRARQILDGTLDLRAIKGWPYRKGLGYVIRSQEDYGEVFHLSKFVGRHIDWKPFVGQLLGFNAEAIKRNYETKEEIEEKTRQKNILISELVPELRSVDEISGRITLKLSEIEELERQVERFNFSIQDANVDRDVVENLDLEVASLNRERHRGNRQIKLLESSIGETKLIFDPKEAEKLFREFKIVFPGQLKKDFSSLISFNKAITAERNKYLREELSNLSKSIAEIDAQLKTLNERRSKALRFLAQLDMVKKYRSATDGLVTLKADLQVLERQKDHLKRVQEIETDIVSLKKEREKLHQVIEKNVESCGEDRSSRYSTVRKYFSEIVSEVIDKRALIRTEINSEGNLEFDVKILDATGRTTSEDLGHTYRKLLCISFDLALLRAYSSEKFYRFVFLDGPFEQLDPRKRANLLGVFDEYSKANLQIIITSLDSDIPYDESKKVAETIKKATVLTLHDEGESGLLFKMKRW